VGQCEISHPVRHTGGSLQAPEIVTLDAYEDAISPSIPVGNSQNVAFTADGKGDYDLLDAPINRKVPFNTQKVV